VAERNRQASGYPAGAKAQVNERRGFRVRLIVA
jgi:hypothetical protein